MLSVHYRSKTRFRIIMKMQVILFVIFIVLNRTCRHIAIYMHILLKTFPNFLQDVIKFLYFLAALYIAFRISCKSVKRIVLSSILKV